MTIVINTYFKTQKKEFFSYSINDDFKIIKALKTLLNIKEEKEQEA